MATIKQNGPYSPSKVTPALGGFAKDTPQRTAPMRGVPLPPPKPTAGKRVAGNIKGGK